MDPLLRPRLRRLRRSPSPAPDGPDAATPPARLGPPRPDDDDDAPTPRVHPRPIAALDADTPLAAPAETPAARLRALLARDRPPARVSPPDSDAESAAGPARFGSSTSSVALKDIFSRALRDPGDTPQKGRLRRNSVDGSSMEITPVVDNPRRHRRAARLSLSDDEGEHPKSSGPSFRLSTAFDALRARLASSSHSQLLDQNLPDPPYDHTSIASTSTSNAQPHPRPPTSSQVTSSRLTPPLNNTLHPSFQMSSQLAFQSNLLDQDSEMQRAMGDVLNSESEAPTSPKNVIPSNSRPSFLRENRHNLELHHRRSSHDLHSSTSSLDNAKTDREHRSQEEERTHQREREWNRPRLPSSSGTPDVSHRHSQEIHRRISAEYRSPSHVKSLSHEVTAGPVHRYRERRDSLASLRSFDDDHSSRPSSTGSQADYRDRISELDRERNHERERHWNKRHPPSRPSSSLSTNSNHSPSHSHPPRSPSNTPYLTPTLASLQRKSSRASLRSDSPSSLASSHESLKEREEEEKKVVVHERERNWNSPRPQWSLTKSPSTSHLRNQSKDGSPLRPSSSLNHLEESRGHHDASRLPATVHGASPKVGSSAAVSPALHKSGGRSGSGLNEHTIGSSPSTPLNGFSPSKRSGASSKFGWNFARSPLPPLELDDSPDRRKGAPSPVSASRLSSGASEAVGSSHIPVRSRMKSFTSADHVPSDMSFTNVVVGDETDSQNEFQSGATEVAELRTREVPSAAGDEQDHEDMQLVTDEESVVDFPQSTTPRSNPPRLAPEEVETDAETEVLSSPEGSPASRALPLIPDEAIDGPPHSKPPPVNLPPVSVTPPGTPPSVNGSQLPSAEMTPSLSLVTPPRPSFASSVLAFRTPSPPHDLPDLPAPPLSSDDDAFANSPVKNRRIEADSNFTLTKTPKPPGAWAATPVPPKITRSASPDSFFPLDSTPPVSTSTPLPRANSLPPTLTEADHVDEDGLLTPVAMLSRAKTLPVRTPAPPGAWLATPGPSVLANNGTDQSQFGSLSRRKGLLKVRFDVTESEASATEGHANSPISAIRLTNPEFPAPGADSSSEGVPQRPTTPDRPTTPTARESRSPRSARKSPSVRLVDAFGRERVDGEGTAGPMTGQPNGHADAERKAVSSPSTPRRSVVRIVDAMGKAVEDVVPAADPPDDRASSLLDPDVSVMSDDSAIGHAEALARMRKTLRDLAESLSDADRSDDLDLNSSHLDQLEEVSKVARQARNQLAHNLHLETAKQYDVRPSSKLSVRARDLSPVTTKKPWGTTIVYCGILIQLLIVLAMWRYAHAEARRLFYTTYYDPLYPEFTPIQGSSCLSGTLSTTRSWTMLDSYEAIRREGWRSIGKEILRALRHVGDQAWERWGEQTRFEGPT